MKSNKPREINRVPLIKVTRSGEIVMFRDLYQKARMMEKLFIENKRVKIPGYQHLYDISIVFYMFTTEAFFNHVGKRCLQTWGDIEKGLGVSSKIELISELLELKETKEYIPIIREMEYFRNSMAHGKTIEWRSEEELPTNRLTEEYQLGIKSYEDKIVSFRKRYDIKVISSKLAKLFELVEVRCREKWEDYSSITYQSGSETPIN